MSEFLILEKIATTKGKNDKRQILEDNKDNKKLEELVDASLNFFRKFYMHKFEVKVCKPSAGCRHDEFMSLLNKLEKREITGNAAKDEVQNFLKDCNEEQQLWYSRVLRKDLKAGFSVNTAAKFFPIPIFDVMLATDGKKCKKMNEIISGGVWSSPKLDGYRCLAVVTRGSVTLYSRNGSVYKNFPAIEESLSKMYPNEDVVLDGEIMSDDFQSMQQTAFSSKSGKSVGDVKFHVFDCIPSKEWKDGKFTTIKSERYSQLEVLSKGFESNIVLVEQELVDTVDKVLKLEQTYMALGYEGVMVIPDIPYYKGRKSNKLMKFKTMLSQDCEVIGFYEGKTGTKHEGRMGGLVIRQENGKECECGSGFSDEDRDYMWNNQDEFLGRLAEIKYQELTNHDILRFPIFMRWRDDK